MILIIQRAQIHLVVKVDVTKQKSFSDKAKSYPKDHLCKITFSLANFESFPSRADFVTKIGIGSFSVS